MRKAAVCCKWRRLRIVRVDGAAKVQRSKSTLGLGTPSFLIHFRLSTRSLLTQCEGPVA